MAKFTIFSKNGKEPRHIGEPQYSGSYMNVDFLEFRTISSPVPIEWQIGDYVDYHRTGLRYKLYSLPQPKKVARRGEYGAAFEYSNVQFFAATKELEIAPFRDLVSNDNGIHFSTRPDVSTFEDVHGIARRIQACMDDLFPNRWRIEVYESDDSDLNALLSETKEYSVSGGSCLDALSQIYEVWKNVGWIHTYDSASDTDIITIGRANVRDEENTSDAFAYGMGNGLTSIKKASANEGEFATRLYVYGSERNIPPRYYNNKNIFNKDSVDIRNLMIPIENWGQTKMTPDARKAYLQADDAIVEKYGLIPRTVYFDGNENEEICPSIEGLTEADVREAMISLGMEDSEYLPPASNHRIDEVYGASIPEDNGVTINSDGTSIADELPATFLLEINSIGFDPMKQAALANETNAIVSIKSGMCAGREFPIVDARWAYGTWFLELERQVDDSLNIAFPNKDYPILKGDQFVFLNIAMPEYYVTIASKKLLAAGQKMLADYTRVSAFYEPGIDAIEVHEGAKVLRAGMYMQVYDKDIIDTEDNTDYVLIDSITIDEKSELPTYKVTLREQKRAARNFSALEDMIEDAKESAKKENDRARQYTDRRFRSAQETLTMLEGAFKNFSEGVNPVTVRTMALLVGDESLQFKFTASAESLDDIPCPLTWDNDTKQMEATESVLIHMTLGVDEVTAKRAREAKDYKHWTIPAQDLDVIDDTKARYVYARVPMDGTTATDAYVLSETYIAIDEEEGFYHLLVGILNSEYNGSRDFVTLYGFTEVLPGQITTDVIRSADGKTYFDLEKGEIGGAIVFTGSNGKTELSNWSKNTDSALADKVNSVDLANLEESLNEQIENLQGQIDGVVETWFYDEEPTLTNPPAKDWTTPKEKENHVGDLYYSKSGKAYRWQKDASGNYYWNQLADEDLSKILESVQKAQDTADNKKRVFVTKPSGPYDVGDLWTDGSDLKVCNRARTSGFAAEDWVLATDYTNDAKAEEALSALAEAVKDIEKAQGDATKAIEAASKAQQKALEVEEVANAAKDMLSSWLEDGVFSKAELSSIKAEQSRIEAEHYEISNSAGSYNVDDSDYNAAYVDYNTELTRIIDALGSHDTIESTMLATYQSYYYDELKPLLDAISTAAKALADAAAQEAERAKQAADTAADAANLLTSKIDSDGYLTELEKQTIRRTMAEITECQGELFTESAVVTMTITTGDSPWNKVKKGDVATVSTIQGSRKVSQDKYIGYYGSNLHKQGASVVRLKMQNNKDFKLKISFLSDGYAAALAYAAAGALGKTIDPVYSESNHGTDQTKTTYTYPYNRGTELNKDYNVTGANSYVDISYYKATAIGGTTVNNLPTDSAYFKILNNHYTSDDGKEHIVELNGSFHKYYLMLMQLGYTNIANELANKLRDIFTLLNRYSVWTQGTTELGEDNSFRAELNAALSGYYYLLATCGFDVMDAKVSDVNYLKSAMKNGDTVVSGGLVMTSLVAVGDTEDMTGVDVEAFINGSDFAKDDTHGKLLLAGGIPETDTDGNAELDKRAKQAETRVYEDGTIYSDRLVLEKGCKIGVLDVTETGIYATEGCDETPQSRRQFAKFDEIGFSVSEVYNTGSSCATTGYAAIKADGIEIRGNKTYGGTYCGYEALECVVGSHVNSTNVGFAFGKLSINEEEEFATLPEDSYSFYATTGKMAGLRPNIQTITTGNTLTPTQHTLVIQGGILYLPVSPLDGQEYKILHTSVAELQIRNQSPSTKNLWDFKNDASKTYVIGSEQKETIELIYNAADNTWYVNKY